MTITDLETGQQAILINLGTDSSIHLKLLSLGLLPGDEITLLNRVPFRGPLSIKHGKTNYFALRFQEAAHIEVQLKAELDG
jgi:Fe2+ transport system protein FeoA